MAVSALRTEAIGREAAPRALARLGPLILLFPEAGPLIAPAKSGHIGLLIAAGASSIRQGERALDLEPGEWTLFAGARPAAIAGAAQVAYAPEDLFCEHGLRVGAMLLQRFGRAATINRVVFSMFRTIFEEAPGLAPADAPALAQAGFHVLKKALIDAARPRGARTVFQERIRDYIEWRIRDPRLSPERVAKALNCTPRNIHRAFEGESETLSQYILRRRLELCRDDLCAEAHGSRSVTEIAFYWGFNNAAHFSRVFRKQFGTAPSACRTQAIIARSQKSVDQRNSKGDCPFDAETESAL